MSDEAISQEQADALIAKAAGADEAESSGAASDENGGASDESGAAGDTEQDTDSDSAPEAEAQSSADSPVRAVEFGQLDSSAEGGARSGVELILDVQMQVAVELGRASMRVRDLLALGPGSVVELEKQSGEPVEVLVNNKMVARGEVVVIDENFGVRITEIINAKEREADAEAA